MKKLLLLLLMSVLALTAMAQRTQKITYQAVVRDAGNRLVVYTPVRVDVTITSSTGSYFESLRDTTNANGLMYVLIGGNPGFEDIDWVEAVIKTVITIDGGESVSDEVTVTAVPLALQASYATNVSPTAPTIVAVYNQIQADSLALANQIAAERAHLDDTLSHYLMKEVQVLSISNDTIYLTGGSFVKLPAGFSGDYNELSNKPDLNQYATNAHLNDTLSHYLMQEVQVLSVSNDTLYLTGGSWVKLPQGFSGDYNDLTNLPDLNQYATNVHLNDTLKNYLTINGLCDSIKNCEVITNLQTADSLLGVRITGDSIALSGKIYSDSVYLKGLIDSIKVNVTNNTTNITNNTTNISNITNNITSLQVADSVLNDRFTRDSIALSNRLDTMFTHICDSVKPCVTDLINDTLKAYTTTNKIDTLLGAYATNAHLNDTLGNYITNTHLNDTLGHYLMQEVQVLSIGNDTIYLTGGSFVKLPAGFSGDYNELSNKPDLNQYATNVHLNDTLSHYLMQEVQVLSVSNDTLYLTGGSWVKLPQGFSGDYNDLTNLPDLNQYATNVHLNDTLSHYTTTDRIDTLLGNYATKDTLKHYLTIDGLCDSIKNCDVITNLLTADSLLSVRINNDSVLFYKADSVLLVHILNDSVLSHQADSILLALILRDSTNLANNYYNQIKINDTIAYILSQIAGATGNLNDNYYTKVEINDTLSHYTTTDRIDTLLGNYATKDTLKSYLTIDGLCDSIKNCDVITNLLTADSLLRVRISNDSILFYKADSVLLVHILNDSVLSHQADSILLALILRDSTNLANNYYNQIKINDTIAYILSQIAGATGNLNDNYYTKVEINDTLSHYTTTDRIDSLLGDYVKKDTLGNYLTIAGLCDSIKNCDVITSLQTADSLLGARITRDSILSYKADSILANRITRDSILFYKADSILAGRITRDSILSYKTDSLLADRITRDSILSYKADSVLSLRITADSINLVNNFYDKIKINDTVAYILSQIAGATGNLNDNYYTKAEINDTLSHYTTSDHVDSLLGDYVKKDTLKNYLTIAGLCDSIKNCDIIANMATGITTNTTNISNNTTNITNNTTNITNLQIADSVLNARFTKDSTALAHRMDTLLKHVCDSVKPCVTEWINDTLKAYTTTNKIDTLLGAYVTNAHLKDTLSWYTTTNKVDTLIQKYGYTTIAHLNDTLGHYTTTNQIDTLIKKYGYLTSDSAVIVTMRDSIYKVNNRLTYDSTALAHRMDTLLKHVCDSVQECVTNWMGDTLKAYTTTNKIDTLIKKYGYLTSDSAVIVMMRDSIQKVNAHVVADSLTIMDTLHYYYVTNAHLNDTLGHYTTTDQIDTLLNKHHYLTSDSTVIVMMRDSIYKVNNRLTMDSTALAHRMDTLLKHVCDSVQECVTNWMGDTLKAYTTTNQIDTLIKKYGYLTSDSAVIVMMRDSIQKVNAHVVADSLTIMDTLHKYYATNDTLNNYYTRYQVDTAKAHIRNEIQNGALTITYGGVSTTFTANQPTGSNVTVEIPTPAEQVQANWNETDASSKAYIQNKPDLTVYATKDALKDSTRMVYDTLHRYYATKDTLKNFLTISGLCDSVMSCDGIERMRDSIQKVNAHVSADSMILAKRIVADSTILAHRMDTLLKHVCDSVKPCVTGWISDTASAIRNSLGDTINHYIGKTDLVIMQGTTTLGTFNANQTGTTVTVVIPTPEDQVKSDWEATTGAAEILHKPNIRDSVNRVVLDSLYAANSAMNKAIDTIARNNIHDSLIVVREKIHTDSTILAHRMDTLLKHVCDSVKPCVTDWMNDTLKAYTTTNKIDTLIQKYGFATNAHLNDTLKVYTTTDKIDTLIRKYGYLTSDSAVIVMMRDSIQKVNAHVSADSMVLAKRIVADSTILAHRMDTLLKHVCDSVKPCVTGWISDTASAIRNSLGDTINHYIGKTDLVIMQGTTTLGTFNANQTGTTVTVVIPTPEDQVKSDWEATTGAAEILHKPNIRDSVNRVVLDSLYAANSAMNKAIDTIARNNIHDSLIVVREKIHTDSTILAHRMDTLLKHVCDSVKPCVTGWMNDTLKAYTTTNKIDTLIQKYGFATNAHLNDTLKVYTTTDKIDTLIRKYGYLTSDSAVIVMMRDSIQKVNAHVSADSMVLAKRIVTDSTILAHRMDTLLKHVCDSVKPCVTGWMNDTLKAYTTTNKIDTLIQKYGFATNAHLNDTLKVYTTTDKIDTLIRKYGYLTSDSAVIVMMRDSIQKVNAHVSADSMVLAKRILADSTILAHRMDTLLKHVCDSVKPCVTGWISDTASAIRNSLGDTINHYIGKTDLVIMQGTTTLGTFNANQTGTTVTVVIPTPEDQVKSDWEATTGAAEILHKPNIRDSVNRVVLDSLYAANSAMNKAIDTIARNNIHDSLIVVREKIHTDSTILAHRMDTLLKHVCDSVKPCVTDWISDSTRMVFDTLHKYYTSLSTLADSMHRVDVRIKNDSLEVVELYKQAQTALQTLAMTEKADSLTLATRMDTLLKHVCDSVQECVTGWIKDSTRMVFDTLHTRYTTLKTLNDTLGRYTTTDQIDTLLNKHHYLTSDSTVIVTMRDSIYKVNNRLTMDSTVLAHRMDTLLKHVCDSVQECVTGWIKDSTRMVFDTLHTRYTTLKSLNDTLGHYTTTNQIDTLIKKYGYLTSDSAVIVTMRDSIQKVNNRLTLDSTALAHRMDTLLKHVCDSVQECVTGWIKDSTRMVFDTLHTRYTTLKTLNDTLGHYTTTNQIDTLIKKYGYLTSDSAVIVTMRDSIYKVNNRLTMDSTVLAHRMDTLLKHVCDSVQECVTGWIKDSTSMVFDTLHKYYATKDTLKNFEKKSDLCKDVMVCIGDTLSNYTTTNQIDTLIRKYGYLTSDSAVIVTMRDSIQKVNNRLTYDSTKLADRIHTDSIALVNRIVTDSTALAHRMDTLLKHVCDSVKPCVTGWISDSTRMVFDTLHTHYTSLKTLADSMHRVDVRIKHDSLEVVELYKQAQTALQTLALKEMADSLTLATRMDTVYKHLCDSVMNCDGIKTMQTNITDVTNNLDSSKTNIRSEISSLNTKLQSNIDSTSQHVRGALKDTAAAIRNSIGNGKLTIQYGTDDPVTFNANQKTDTSIIIPVPTAPNDATLTIQKNGTTVGTFTANQAADQTIDITVPTCDSLAECDLIKSILARLDKLERQNDSLAKEIEKLQPALTVNGPQKDTVCSNSTKIMTYTATFHNCSSSDYALAWNVNGTDSSAVTGAVLTLNVKEEGTYKVVCIATRSDSTFVTDTVTTMVTVDDAIPSFTANVNGLTVELTNITNTATIQWDTDSLPVPFSGTSATHTYSVADTITITVTSKGGCTFIKGLRLQATAPVVTTDSVPASTIAATTAKAYGTVTSDGGIPETKRGILYSTSDQNLEYGANGVDSVVNGTGMGSFTCNLTRLVPCTQYYVRAFAYNEVDTVYGDVLNFNTPSFTCGSTLTDFDNNEYETLLLGSQCWMKQNLRTTHYANGTEIPLGDCHSNRYSPLRLAPGTEVEDTLRAYGYLYNWYAASANSSSAANPSTAQGVCPDGWHLPSDAEWTQLTDFVASNRANVCGSDPKNIIKSLVSDEWRDLVGACSGHSCLICDSTSNNNTLFTVRSTGTWNSGTGGAGDSICRYTNYGHTIFTSATEYDNGHAWVREFYTEHAYVDATAISKTTGMSVRCVLNKCSLDTTYLPTVSPVSLTNTGGATVSMAANVDSDGGANVTERGVCWSDSPQPTTSSDHATSGTGIGNFSISEDFATPGDTFYVRAYAINSKGLAYGAEVIYVVPSLPTVTTADVTEILANTATTGGEVTATGGISVTARGVCYSESENPTIGGYHTTDSSGLGSFVSHPMNLTPEHTYYVRAYATNAVGTAYGEEKTFTTPAKSLSLTSDRPATVKMCGANSQTVTYTVTPSYVGDYNYSWSCSGAASGTPDSNTYTVTYTSADTYTVTCMEENSGISQTISTTITNVSHEEPVYLAMCIEGLTISSKDNLNNVGAVKSISWGDGNITTITNQTPKDFSYTYNSPGVYTVTITADNYHGNCEVSRIFAIGDATIEPCTVAAPHTNSSTYTSSTGGIETTNSEGKVTMVADNSGHTYKVVQIGSQCWMAKNLRTTKNPNGTVIADQYDPLSGASDDLYGYFYSWTAVMNDSSASNTNPSNVRGICPLGWHVPSDAEWTEMENEVNGSDLPDTIGDRGEHAEKLVTGCGWGERDTRYPQSPLYYSFVERDSSGFDALPAGYATDNSSFGTSANFWTSSTDGTGSSIYICRKITPYSKSVDRAKEVNTKGYSLRCVRDDGYAELEALPMATTGIVENIVDTSATLHGSVTIPNGVDVTGRGFEYKPIGGTYTKVPADGTELTKTITGLTPNTSYVFRAFASTVNSTVYGDEVSFTTLLPPLSLTASPAVDTLIVWTGAEREITYTATFTNVNSSDYTISWKVNGTDSSTVTGQQLTVNVGIEGDCKVVCIATREGYTTLKDSISTYVKVVGNIVDLSTLTSNYPAQNYDILTDTLIGNYQISIAPGATVVLRDVTINGTNDEDYEWAGITCEGSATIILEGTNVVKGFYENYPGLYVETDSTLTIQGTDTDTLTASSNGWATGIGGGVGLSCGNIVINGGTINAYGGAGSAGIGGGVDGSCGNISINGGKVTAIGGQVAWTFLGQYRNWFIGAGIGTGIALSVQVTCGNISISGGEVVAKGGNGVREGGNNYGAGIGTGCSYQVNQCGNISISGGKVEAFGAHYSAAIGNGVTCGTWNYCGNISINGEETDVEAIGGNSAAGIGNGCCYGSNGFYCECGDITIDSNVIRVKADKGGNAANSIGKNNRFDASEYGCGTVTVGGTGYGTGIPTTPFIYEPTH